MAHFNADYYINALKIDRRILRATACYGACMPRQFRLSVRPSHTRVLYQNGWAAERIIDIEILSLFDRRIIPVFRHQWSLRKSDGFTSNGGAEYQG